MLSVVRLLSIACALAAEWADRPFPNWSENTVLKLLTDSPWAKGRTVTLVWRKYEKPFTYKDVPGADPTNAPPPGSPVGGIGAPKSSLPDRADLIVRWASARPLREAKALYLQRDRKGELSQTKPEPQPAEYVVELFGIPAEVAHKGTASIEAIVQNSALLRTKSGRTEKPSRVVVTVSAVTLSIDIYFPRTKPLTLEDKEVEVIGDLQLFQFREKFNLRSMTYGGALEL